MKRRVTIGREFGSGGREIGRQLAEHLHFAYYDLEIVKEIAKRTDMAEEYASAQTNDDLQGHGGSVEVSPCPFPFSIPGPRDAYGRTASALQLKRNSVQGRIQKLIFRIIYQFQGEEFPAFVEKP